MINSRRLKTAAVTPNSTAEKDQPEFILFGSIAFLLFAFFVLAILWIVR